MTKLARHERFKDARVSYNQHGTQSIKEVSTATEIKQSLISDLENENKDRGVSYTVVATLARYYGVSSDWLLGLSEDYHIGRQDAGRLGISGDNIANIILYRDHPDLQHLAPDYMELANFFLELAFNPDIFLDFFKLKQTIALNPTVQIKDSLKGFPLPDNPLFTSPDLERMIFKNKFDDARKLGFWLLEPKDAAYFYLSEMLNSIRADFTKKYFSAQDSTEGDSHGNN